VKQEIEQFFYGLRAAWCHRWAGLCCAWLFLFLGWVGVMLLPNRYESKALVYVDAINILKPLLQGIAVSSNAISEADIVRRALLARPTLERVARQTGMIRPALDPDQAEKLITTLANGIAISGNRDTGVYTISYAGREPKLAQAVVQELLNTFVSSSRGADKNDVDSARQFLTNQVAQYEARLAASEQKLADFKKKNLGVIANSQGDSFQRLQSEQLNLEKSLADLDVAIQQRHELRRQITGSNGATSGGEEMLASKTQMPSDREIQEATALDTRIQQSQRQLDELLLVYTARHPDVIALRATIAALDQRRRSEYGEVRPTTATVNEAGGSQADNVLQDIQIQLNSKNVQIVALQEQVNQAEHRVASLRNMLGTGPQVEAELAGLNRDYGVTKGEYEQLSQRLESANITGQANANEGVAYRIIEAPRVPLRPISPRRKLLLAAVLFAALIFGAAAAWIVGQVKPRFMDLRALRGALDLPVLGAISYSPGGTALRWRRIDLAAYATGIVALIGVGAAAILLAHPASEYLQNLTRGGP
jgi:polysaccharide chain length determinant protein (PEP-CTERM system associated)